MALNPFFRQEVASEQRLVQDLVNEHLRMYGQEVYYMPRKYFGTDSIMRENILAEFNDAYPIEAYVANVEGFQGSGDLMTKFGIRVTDEITFILSKERFEDYIADIMSNRDTSENARRANPDSFPDRPMEGDLIYFPLTDSFFEIKFVEHENPFYQLGSLYTYELKCELFEFEQEIISTSIEDIDNSVADIGYVITLTMAENGTTATATGGLRDGAVNQIVLLNDGYGYSTVPTVSISTSPNGSSFANATAVAIGTIGVGQTTYSIQSIELTNVGFGYTQAPTVTIVGDGSGARARANIGTTGVPFVDNIVGGSGYTRDANVGIVTSPVGLSSANAIARAIVSAAGTISEIRFINAGFGYTQSPTFRLDAPFRKRSAFGVVGVTTSVGTYTTTGIGTSSIGIGTTVVGIATTVGTLAANPTTQISGIDTTGIQLGDALQVGLGISDGTVITGIGSTNAPDVLIVGLALTVGIGSTVFQITRVESTGADITTSITINYTETITLGSVSSIDVRDTGIGYTVAPIISIGNPSGFSTGIATVTINPGIYTDPAGIGTVIGPVWIGGTVTGFDFTNLPNRRGTGYGSTPAILISDPSGFRSGIISAGLGTGVGIGTTIKTMTILDRGLAYLTAPIVTISPPADPNGVQATAETTIIDGILVGVNISNAGTGYTTTQVIDVTLTGGIGTATAVAGINTVGFITSITITNPGLGYTTVPSITFIGGINTATATAFINSSGIVTGTNITNAGFGYTTPPSITFSEPRNPLNSGDYLYREMVVGQTGLTTAIVKKWNAVTRKLEVSNVAGNFGIGEIIVGTAGTVGAADTTHVTGAYMIETIEYDQLDTTGVDSYADNKEFQDAADDIVDWNETNPFGTF